MNKSELFIGIIMTPLVVCTNDVTTSHQIRDGSISIFQIRRDIDI